MCAALVAIKEEMSMTVVIVAVVVDNHATLVVAHNDVEHLACHKRRVSALLAWEGRSVRGAAGVRFFQEKEASEVRHAKKRGARGRVMRY
jgi:hypothetical protein